MKAVRGSVDQRLLGLVATRGRVVFVGEPWARWFYGRVPEVCANDELMGIVTLDSLLKILAHKMNQLLGSMDTRLQLERVRRP